MDEEKKQPEAFETSTEADQSESGLTASPAARATEEASSSDGADSSGAESSFAWEELKNEPPGGVLPQAVQDLTDFSKLKESDSPPAPDRQKPPDAKASLSNRLAWTVAGGLVLAGFLTWVLSSLTLKMPYWLEATVFLFVGAGWVGLGLKKFKLPTVVGGLALIWTLGLLLGICYGLPSGQDQALWARTLLFLTPVGLFSLTTLAAVWGLMLVVKKRTPRLIGLVIVAWGTIPLLAAYYSIRAGHREASFTDWISSPIDFLANMPWFLSPAFFTLIIIPFFGILIWLARQVMLFKLTRLNRHFGPLWLALSFLACLLLGGIYLENVFQKDLGLGKLVTRAVPWASQAGQGAAESTSSHLTSAPPQQSAEPAATSGIGAPEPGGVPGANMPEAEAPGAPQPIEPLTSSGPAAPDAQMEALRRQVEALGDRLAEERQNSQLALELMSDRLERLEQWNQALRGELELLKQSLPQPQGEPPAEPLEELPPDSILEETGAPAGSEAEGPGGQPGLGLAGPDSPGLRPNDEAAPVPTEPPLPDAKNNRQNEIRLGPDSSAIPLGGQSKRADVPPPPKTRPYQHLAGQFLPV